MNKKNILALKYRPQDFKDLIGQEIMASTVTNAIKIGKTPNAYLLTGIRGVGKTTTARLIAKALNCQNNDKTNKDCTPTSRCQSCLEIINSNHIDVLEMDAASKTGIDDVRELIENSKYSPTSAKYKIFIIDEVHMLSKQAFNGLLKTLEEPPPSLKFILATTEVKKIPITILSRCQRFDLKRVSFEKIFDHLKKISLKESGKISDDALKLISKVSEGSVRDGISLLDRSLTFQTIDSDKEINDQNIRDMLGLADRSNVIQLVKEILNGNTKEAVKILKMLQNHGLDAKLFLNDILEILGLINRKISLGHLDNDKIIPESEIKLLSEVASGVSIEDLGLIWQYTIKTLDDLKIISDENITLEMYVMQITHLKDIRPQDTYDMEESSNINLKSTTQDLNEKKENEDILKIKDQLKNTDQLKTKIINKPILESKEEFKKKISTYEDLVKQANLENEIELKYDLERNVKLVSFKPGKIDITFNEKLNKNFIKILTEKLVKWTGERWIISLSKSVGKKTLFEKQNDEKKQEIEDARTNSKIKSLLNTFSDAKLINVEKKEE